MIKMKLLALFAFLSVFTLFSCVNKKQIEDLNAKIDAQTKLLEEKTKIMEENLNNQTSLFYETVGKNIPIVVPEESQKKFEDLVSRVNESFSDIENEQKFYEALSLYKEYINKTAPWIQDSQSAELFELKGDLDYIKINIDYQKNPQNQESVLNELSEFILLNSGYSKIEIVSQKYEDIFEAKLKLLNDKSLAIIERNKSNVAKSSNYDELIRNTNQQINVLYSENISDNLTDLQLSLSAIIEKQNELRRKEYIEPIIKKTEELLTQIDNAKSDNGLTHEKFQLLTASVESQLYLLASENMLSEANNLKTKHAELEQKFTENQNQSLYKKYQTDFDAFVASAKNGNYANENYISLQQTIPFIKVYKPGKHDEDDIILFDWKIYSDLSNLLVETEKLFEPIKNDLSKYDDLVISTVTNNVSIVSRNVSLISHTKIIDTKKLLTDAAKLLKELENLNDKKIKSENTAYLSEYKKSFTSFKKSAIDGTFSQSNYSNLKNKLNVIENIYPDEYQKLSVELEEVKLYSDMKETLSTCKYQINSMKVGIGESRKNSIKISALNEQIASMQYNLSIFKNINIQTLNNELNSVISLFNSKLAELERNFDDEQKQLVKRYNSKVLAKLKYANSQNNRLNSKETWKGYKKADKLKGIKDGKISILKHLEKIDTNYLYPSVYTMYNQIYGQLWTNGDGDEALEVEEQFAVLDWSLTNTKWGLYDDF
ncbi:hypothetical protein [Treponema saccharophilum]|uniref:hypothetical protein n=1 Tax=Treponema saccharophilum TaxID=165 RepID=UPI00386A9BBE